MPTTREAELHEHYASNALATGHAPTCAMVTTDTNWPTISGRPDCTCRVGGNTPAAQIGYRHRNPQYISAVLPAGMARYAIRLGAALVGVLDVPGNRQNLVGELKHRAMMGEDIEHEFPGVRWWPAP